MEKLKYLEVYSVLKKEILKNKYKNKLPSIRELVTMFSYNKSTIQKALDKLKEDNLIVIRPKKGIFICNSYRTEDIKKPYSLDFKSAIPRSNIFPLEEFKNSVIKVLDNYGAKSLEYEESQGYLPLRREISFKLAKKFIKVREDSIYIIPGTKNAIEIIFKNLIYQNNYIAIESPYYPEVFNIFKELGITPLEIPMEEDGINLKKLENFLKKYRIKLLYTIPNFHNPTGISLSEEKMKNLIKLAEKYDFYILEDDTMSELNYKKNSILLKSLDNYDRVIYLKSFSKIFNPGFKLSYILLPNSLKLSFENIFFKGNYFTSSLNQRAFYYFFKEKTWETHIENLKKNYEEKFFLVESLLENCKNIAIVHSPQGGLFFWLKIKNIDALYLQNQLLKFNIGIGPGILFSEKYNNYFRFSFARESLENIKIGIEKIKEIINKSSKNKYINK